MTSHGYALLFGVILLVLIEVASAPRQTPSSSDLRNVAANDPLQTVRTAEPDQSAAKLTSTGPLAALRTEAQPSSLSGSQTRKPVIVLDPGHGGHDSGARKNGVQEKNVVLAFAKTLKRELEQSGRYTVLMTRTDDRFVTLDGRRQFAEDSKAALFMSIHADYARGDARGATIYSLRASVADRLKRKAKQDIPDQPLGSETQFASKPSMGTTGAAKLYDGVKDMLTDLALKEIDTVNHRTERLSDNLVDFMSASTIVRKRPTRRAAFKILKTVKVPAVLVELAYVTNAEDARLLASQTWRDKVSGSLVRAIDTYFSRDSRPF